MLWVLEPTQLLRLAEHTLFFPCMHTDVPVLSVDGVKLSTSKFVYDFPPSELNSLIKQLATAP